WPGNMKATCARFTENLERGAADAVASRDGDRGIQVDVLNDVQKLDALFHRPLERLASRDHAGAAGALVDDRRLCSFLEVARAFRRTARIDQPDAAHIAADDLIARQIDRVICRQLLI